MNVEKLKNQSQRSSSVVDKVNVRDQSVDLLRAFTYKFVFLWILISHVRQMNFSLCQRCFMNYWDTVLHTHTQVLHMRQCASIHNIYVCIYSSYFVYITYCNTAFLILIHQNFCFAWSYLIFVFFTNRRLSTIVSKDAQKAAFVNLHMLDLWNYSATTEVEFLLILMKEMLASHDN